MGNRLKLLLVDDELFLREQVCANVSWGNYGVELIGSCKNAMDALEQMIDEMPDILITDIKMPVMNGLELIASAKQMNPLLYCVVLSGYAEFTLAQAAIEQGVQNYILKPFSKVEFENTLEKCCSQIRRKRLKEKMDLESRTESVSKLSQELWELRGNGTEVGTEQIRKLMFSYPDLIMLREAMIFLLMHQDGESEIGKKWIPRLYGAGDDILETVANTLNEIPCKREHESDLVCRIKMYTQQHYIDESLNLQLIADQVVHLGVKYIGRCFLKETGMKFSEYLLGIRMEKAKKMLKTAEDYRIEEVAEQIGLGHDIPYFYQLFKRYTGMTPKEYSKS